MNIRTSAIFGLAIIVGIFSLPAISQANDLKVSNVRLGPRDANAKTLAVFFDLSWQNSWRNKINHDAVWVTVRLQDAQAGSSEKKLCRLSVSGLNPSGTSAGSNSDLAIQVPADKAGAFIRRVANHATAPVTTTSAMVTVNYDACGLSAASEVSATLVALEMVYVPRGAFYAGDYAASPAAFQRGGADNNPWPIASESAINVSAASANGYYYVSAGNAGEMPSAAAFTIPAAFPKGFDAFYMMKYEITEGQWVEFVNSLSFPARSRRDVTNASHKNSDTVIARDAVACAGSPLVCTTDRPYRAMTFLSWPDVCAFLDWAGLRPMTELEFEKAARGPFLPVNGEYAWGTADIQPVSALSSGAEEGGELSATPGANARFDGILLSGGDAAGGSSCQGGPLRVGIFATDASNRISSGAGNYGAMELSGNVKEWTVSVGHSAALAYTGVNGDGALTTTTGFEGNADTALWPGMDVDASHGVIHAAGAGFRGGSWADPSARLAISDRTEAASSATDAAATYGGRGVRSAEGQ